MTESIGERMALKARGAKHKFDKNLKTSSEALTNISTETTQRLKKLGSNFTLTKNRNKDNMNTSHFNVDRPQTLPPNDQVFNGITFTSPLSNKTKGVYDLRSQELDNSYEVPRNVKVAKSNEVLGDPPSYTDTFQSNTTTEEDISKVNSVALEAAKRVKVKQQIREELSIKNSERNSSNSCDLPSPTPPMPTIPAPELPKEFVDCKEPTYGIINHIQPPVRQKRRTNYEAIELRRVLPVDAPEEHKNESSTSLRMNVDSVELHELNKAAALQDREESLILREKIKAEEMNTPQPDRSDSWEYHEEQDSSSSIDEPFYVNQEPTYGNVFELASSNKDILTPRNALINISEEDESQDESFVGAVGGIIKPHKDIIEEFDPLLKRKTLKLGKSDMSNQLLLLEHLLEEDTYGGVKGEQSRSDDDISMCTSEEDNHQAEQKKNPDKTFDTSTPAPPTSSSSHRLQIVHQNAQLLSDSKEDILDNDFEARVKPYLSRLEEKSFTSANIDLSRPSHNRSRWFVSDETQKESSKMNVNSTDNVKDFSQDCESPPSYLEAIGANENTQKQNNNTNARSSTSRFMNNTMNVLSNVKIRMDALKRKASFKNQSKSCDVKFTIQMIPRPSLSPLLVRYEGPLIRFPSGVVEDILKEMQNRKAILRDRQFQTFLDQEMKTPKEAIPLENITTLQCVSNSRVTDNSTHFYCFEITTAVPKNSNSSSNMQQLSNPNLIMTSASSSASGNVKLQRIAHLYGVSKESERLVKFNVYRF